MLKIGIGLLGYSFVLLTPLVFGGKELPRQNLMSRPKVGPKKKKSNSGLQ